MSEDPEEMSASRDAEAAMWCLTLADGQLDAQEREAFDTWIADAANATALEDAIRVWRAADQAADLPETIRARAASFDAFRRAQRRRWAHRVSFDWRWPSAIAATLIALLLGIATLHDPTTAFRTGLGERRVAVLDDGSRISLDGDTEVDVRFSRHRRELILRRGRAKFDVAHDPSRPFSVAADDKVVVATGTSFSVELLRRQARVLLYEGHVAVLESRTNQPVPASSRRSGPPSGADDQLTPGHELVVATSAPAARATVEPVDLARSRAWEAGQLDFSNESLPTAVERMNRYSSEKIVIADDETAMARIDGVFDVGDVDAFIEAVTELSRAHVDRANHQITLSRTPVQKN